MKHRLKETFAGIHAEEELKKRTRAFLFSKMQGASAHKAHKKIKYKQLVPVAMCFLLVCIVFSVYQIYFTPTSVISIDVNPSIELAINRFDKVISVEAYNEDGQALKNSLNIQFLGYTDAVEQILTNKDIQDYLSQDEILSIVVTGSDNKKNEKILSELESCTAGQKNTYCYRATFDEVAAAHAEGLSYGKYKAFLEVQKYDPSITPEEIQEMSMRQIQDLIRFLSDDPSKKVQDYNNESNGHNGAGYGHGFSQGRQNGKNVNGQ